MNPFRLVPVLVHGDVAFAPSITRLDHLQLEAMWDKRPRIAGWYERMVACPAYRSAVIDWLQDDYSRTELMIEKGAEVKAQVLDRVAD